MLHIRLALDDPPGPPGSLVLNAVNYLYFLFYQYRFAAYSALFRQQRDSDKKSVSVLYHTRRFLPLRL